MMSSSQGATPFSTSNTQSGSGNPAVAALKKKHAGTSPFMQKKPRFGPGSRARPPPSVPKPAPPSRATQPQNINRNVPVSAPAPSFQEFPIYISKSELGEGARFHGIRFQAKTAKGAQATINPFAPEQFTRPVRLHRRYARDKQQADTEDNSGVDDKERELHNARRAERQAEREANQALIAPSGNGKKPIKRKKNQKNVEDVYYDDKDPKQQKAAQLRYEETKPWHLEDFDSKNIWVGSYQEPLSENSVLFEITSEGFMMLPVERWYTFRQTDKIQIMDSEEVEKQMSQRYQPGRWYMKTQDKNDEARKQQALQQKQRAAREDDDFKRRATGGDYRADLDELDYEAKDEFQDDDEGLIFGDDDEDAKETEKRVRDEMREANLPATNMKKDDKDWDEAEDQEREDQKAERKLQKKLRKRIVKHEKKFEYDSDSEHPYSESSEDDESEEERQRVEEERVKKEEAQRLQANGGRSGASTHGTNTPVGRTEKRDVRPNGSFNGSLKRPGSPSLSEVSGSESRKKARGMNGKAVPSGHNLSVDSARSPLSRSMGGYGSGSDTDVSRSGRSKNRAPGSPHEGSPAGSQPGSRVQSPGRRGTPPPRMPSTEEILNAIPDNGITTRDLANKFKTRVSKDKTSEFIALIKRITVQDQVTKLLRPVQTT